MENEKEGLCNKPLRVDVYQVKLIAKKSTCLPAPACLRTRGTAAKSELMNHSGYASCIIIFMYLYNTLSVNICAMFYEINCRLLF